MALALTAGSLLTTAARGALVPPRQRILSEMPPPSTLQARPIVVFLAFDGESIVFAETDDSRTNTSRIERAAVDYVPFGEGAARDALMQAVAQDWAAYGASIVDARPAQGDYVMAIVSPSNPYSAEGYLGIAPLDCTDSDNRNNVVFAWHGPEDGYSANERAHTVSQEVAHSLGLEHSYEPTEIMSYSFGPGETGFVDACTEMMFTDVTPISYCVEQHALFCPPGQQNSHAELLALLGAANLDTQGPSLSIATPVDGDEFLAGTEFEIEIDAADDVGVQSIELFVNDELIATDHAPPWAFPATNTPSGNYRIYAVARDAGGNAGVSPAITIGVSEFEAGDETSSGGGESTTEPTDTDEGDDDSVPEPTDDDAALPPGFGAMGEPAGCACNHSRGRGGAVWWLALGWGLRRRRRVESPSHRTIHRFTR